MSNQNCSMARGRDVGWTRLGPTLIEPTRRNVLAIGASAALAPLLRGTAVAQPVADLPALEGAVDRLVREVGVKPAEPGLAVTLL
jgi:hypothetical protein